MAGSRQIGLAGATFLVVANMLGTGIFTTSGFLLADLPSRPLILLAWLVGGGIALLGAICYGALARRLPESGGEYLFLSRTIHPAAGYVGGWLSMLVGFSAPIAAAAFALSAYTKPWFPEGLDPKWIGTTALFGFALLHSLSVRRAVRFQNMIVVLKIVLIFGLIAVAGANFSPSEPPVAGKATIGAFAVSLVWISFAFSGWNAAVYVGGEVMDPERTIPKAMVIGTVSVIILYLLLNVVFLYGAPAGAVAGRLEVARIAAGHLAGPAFAEFTTALIALALLTSISAMIMAGPRVYAQMAKDGYLPRWLGSEHPPASNAVLLQLAVALLMFWVPNFPDLAKYIGFTLGLGTALTVIGLIRLKLREPERVSVPGWPWVPALFLLSVGGVTAFAIIREPRASMFGILTIVLGLAAWRIHTHVRPGNRSDP